jgi:PEP-CTERM motif
MKCMSLALGALALAVLTSTSAFASSIDFSFSFSGSNYSGAGTFVTTYEGGNQYLITGITSGEVNGTAITGLLSAGSFPTGFGNVPNDNILVYPGTFGINSPSYFDNAGVSFTVGSGKSLYDVNLNDTFFFENAVTGSGDPLRNKIEFDSVRVDPAASPVPEPSSFVLLGSGILGLAGAARRKFLKA